MLGPQQLFARLEELGIARRTVEHAPVFTVEQAKALRGDLPGHHVKNLFLRNKKEEMWLVVALEEHDPRVFLFEPTGPSATPNSIVINTQTMQPGEDLIVGRRLREILSAARKKAHA